MKTLKIHFAAMILLSLLAAGCTLPGERAAFAELEKAGRKYYPSNIEFLKASPPPKLDKSARLADYLTYAALNNPELEAAFYRWKAALEKVPQARALQDPKFTYGYYIKEVETRVGPQRQKFGIAQTFPWFGKLRLKGGIALEAANAERARYEAVRRALFRKVKDVYYEYYYLGRAIATTEENLALVKHLEKVARARYKAAVGKHPDVIRAQVELGKLGNKLAGLQDLKKPLAAKLNAALNRSLDVPLAFPEKLAGERSVVADSSEVLKRLLKNNPELRALDFAIAKNEKAKALAKKNWYPDITLSLETIDTKGALMHGTKDSGKDPLMATVSINLPLWFGKYDAAEKQASAALRAARAEKKDRANLLSAELSAALYRIRDAERKITLYRDTLIPKAEESLKVTQKAFETASGDFLSLIDAERVLLEFKLSFERAFTDYRKAFAEVEELAGDAGVEYRKEKKR